MQRSRPPPTFSVGDGAGGGGAPHLSVLALLPPAPSFSHLLQVHARLATLGLSRSRSCVASLLSVASSLAHPAPLHYPLALFSSIARPNTFAANHLLRCLARSPSPLAALRCYCFLRRTAVRTNSFTYTFLLQACASGSTTRSGEQVHAHVVIVGVEADVFVRNALVHFYAACRDADRARKVFDESPAARDVVSWNAVLNGYVKAGRLVDAEVLFGEMPKRDAISWSVMLNGYVQNGDLEKGIWFFRTMVERGVTVNEAAVVTVLSAAAQLGLLKIGRTLHEMIRILDFPVSMAVGTALIDMYSKCGSVDMARQVFAGLKKKDVFAWNALICGLAIHGLGNDALELFQRFISEGLKPTSVTFVGVLNGCSRAGLVAEGQWYYGVMSEKYGIEPEMEHYGCMVDLLGRAGLVSEAVELIDKMKEPPDPVLWGTLLGACKTHGLLDLGVKIGSKLIELQPNHDGNYVLLSSIFAKAQKWDDVSRVRRLFSSYCANKIAGWSLIEAYGVVHRFLVSDKSHENSAEIYKTLAMIDQRLGEAGYVPDVTSILHDVGDEEKVQMIKEHSERLAIAFGFIAIPIGEPIHVVKNLRVCGDCHEFSKMVTKVFNKEIIVRDGSRFHHMKDGLCSCGDYW